MFNGGARYYIECCSDEEEHFKDSILSLLFLFYFIIFFFCFVLFILLASIFVCVGFFTSDAQTSMALWNFELWYLQQICCSVLYLDEIYVTQIEEFCLCSVCFDFFFFNIILNIIIINFRAIIVSFCCCLFSFYFISLGSNNTISEHRSYIRTTYVRA